MPLRKSRKHAKEKEIDKIKSPDDNKTVTQSTEVQK